jgi:serine/threonine protein kinase
VTYSDLWEPRDRHARSSDEALPVTTQSPTWREQSSAGSPSGDRATSGAVIGGRYELRTPVGNGGMGTVWRATDTLLRRDVAVKEVILPPTMPRGEKDALCERTLREARAAAALSHPSVVQVYDVVTDGGRPWIVMELLDARSLADMVIDDGPLSARAVAKIGIAMLGALEVAHAAGVLHRDVKPANVLICADGRCVLTDFGVARLPTESKLTTPGMVLGSPHFISPERAVGGAFGPPSDLFSLGVTLYTAVEGGPPFDRGDPFETMRAVVEESPRPPKLAGPLQPVLMGLLEKEPSQRWTVDQARAVLRELLSGSLSRSGRARHDTDPTAIVRQPTGPPPAIREPGLTRQVGGRAMLDPDESLTGQLARLRAAHGLTGEVPANAAGSPAMLDSSGHSWNRPGPVPYSGTDEWGPGAPVPRQGAGRRRAPSASSQMAGQVRGRVRDLGSKARRPANRSRIIVGGGLAILIVVVGVAALSGAFSGSNTPNATPPTATATAANTPLIPVQPYKDSRGLSIDVPKDWTKSASSTYVDFVDPNGGRKIRINVESATGNAQHFFEIAETGLKKPSICPQPYKRVALNDATLAGRPGAELEYTCGSGDSMRHGIWGAVIVDGKAYHFYLTVPDAQFAASKVIFDEMVRSFQLNLS